ncbi:MAG: HEAT repeat domain-containing protein [Elusimicrobiota bacterium]|nr:HEAT repeat domain-containing protein [Elusimicrobiota bacterium]
MLLLAAGPAFLAISAQAARTPVVKSTAAARAELGREAVALLSSSGADPDPEVRAVVAVSWGELRNRAAIPFLKRALTDANPDVRIAAAASLYRLGEVDGLTNLIDETKTAGGAPPTTPAQELRRMARDAARARAVLKLGEVAGENARAALLSAQRDPEGEVRDAAAIALARLGSADASAPFLSAIADDDEAVRASAARSLGLIGREGRDILLKLAASDASVSVRAEACAALGSFNDPADVAALEAALADKSGRVRLAAARALARRDGDASTAALKAFLEKAPPAEAALVAQAGLAERGDDVTLELADMTLGQDDPELKSLAVKVLAAARRPEALEALAKAMRTDGSRRVRVEAAAAVITRLRRVEGAR